MSERGTSLNLSVSKPAGVARWGLEDMVESTAVDSQVEVLAASRTYLERTAGAGESPVDETARRR